MQIWGCRGFVALAALMTSAAVPALAQSFTEIDTGNSSSARAVSADGTTVVGVDGDQPFRFTTGPTVETIGITDGIAHSVSGDGSVIVGEFSDQSSRPQAFLQTQAGGVVNLGSISSGSSLDSSAAFGVSDDGTIVVGVSSDFGGTLQNEAFRWTQATGMVSLGTFATAPGAGDGSNASAANGISADGTTIVGQSTGGSLSGNTAFRWTQAGGMQDLGGFSGATASEAYAVSGDGSVVVGAASPQFGAARAFRWTEGTGMVALTDGFSRANDISDDGNVIVGIVGVSGEGSRAFRHTQTGGVQVVEDWLRAQGVTLPTNTTQEAFGTNADGSVIVGATSNGDIFIARGDASVDAGGGDTGGGDTGGGDNGGGDNGGGDNGGTDNGGGDTPTPGIITVDDLNTSLVSSASSNRLTTQKLFMMMNGAGSRPLDRAVEKGKWVTWIAGDWGTDDHGARDGEFGLAEIGAGHNFGPVQANVTVGRAGFHQNTVLGGRTEVDGFYAKAELLSKLFSFDKGGLWGILTGSGFWGDAEISRNYLDNGGVVDTSTGKADITGYAVRGRLEMKGLVKYAAPFVDVTWSRTCLDAYTETGGAFPASFNELCNETTEARYGFDATVPVSDDFRLTATVEGVHRFDDDSNAVSGTVTGLTAFSFAQPADKRNWVRGGAGFETDVGSGTLSVMANATTEGESSNFWIAAALRFRF